jgi:hypothetical protein
MQRQLVSKIDSDVPSIFALKLWKRQKNSLWISQLVLASHVCKSADGPGLDLSFGDLGEILSPEAVGEAFNDEICCQGDKC